MFLIFFLFGTIWWKPRSHIFMLFFPWKFFINLVSFQNKYFLVGLFIGGIVHKFLFNILVIFFLTKKSGEYLSILCYTEMSHTNQYWKNSTIWYKKSLRLQCHTTLLSFTLFSTKKIILIVYDKLQNTQKIKFSIIDKLKKSAVKRLFRITQTHR